MSLENRNSIPDEMNKFLMEDSISNWEHFQSELGNSYAISRHGLLHRNNDEDSELFSIIQGKIVLSVVIKKNFSVQLMRYNTPINVRNLLGYQCKLERWSQLEAVVNYGLNEKTNSKHELEEVIAHLTDNVFIHSSENDSTLFENINYLLRNILLQISPITSRRYSPKDIVRASLFYLASRRCYKIIRRSLALPHPDTMKKYLGGLSQVGSAEDCKDIIEEQLKILNNLQKHVVLIFDEVYVQASYRFRGNHIIGLSEDDPESPAKTILAFMIRPLMGGEAFICRLIPIHSLQADFIKKEIESIIPIISAQGGKVVAIMSDNHFTNTNCFKSLFQDANDSYPWVYQTPSDKIYLLFDPVHLLKNLRNNWLTEQHGQLALRNCEDGKMHIGKWSDIKKVGHQKVFAYYFIVCITAFTLCS